MLFCFSAFTMDNFDIFNAGSNPEMIPNKKADEKAGYEKIKIDNQSYIIKQLTVIDQVNCN